MSEDSGKRLLKTSPHISIMTDIRMCTFNSRGHSLLTLEYMKKIICECDVLFIQEHWLFDDEMYLLNAAFDNVYVFGHSGMENDELLRGRPFGGCACIVPLNSRVVISPLPRPMSRRIQSCIMSFDNVKFLILNVYMPCEDNRGNESFNDVLMCMQGMIESFEDVHYVIVCGDFNTSFVRPSYNSRSLTRFCNEMHLMACENMPMSSVDFTYRSDMNDSQTRIDHFFVSVNLVPSVIEYIVLSMKAITFRIIPLFSSPFM